VPAEQGCYLVCLVCLVFGLNEANQMNQSNQTNKTNQINQSLASQACLLIYDGQCRLCVTAKKRLEQLETHAEAAPVRMVPYQSEEAKQALGKSYLPGRPNVAFLVRPDGEIARGLDAFLALLPGIKGGKALSVLLSFRLVKPFGYLLYWFVARFRYSIFGQVPLAGASENPGIPGQTTPPK
jgi:predicted DCC family thiol-disulfide oxidoreductase YuxK